jgi:hypothetical protein
MDKICSQFQIGLSGLKSYTGSVLVDADDFYFVVGMNMNTMLMGGLLGGAIGGAIAGAIAHKGQKSGSYPFATTFGELPPEIKSQPAWGRISSDAKVMVVPRSAVRYVTKSIWVGCIVKTDEAKFLLKVPFFTYSKATKSLAKYRWA